MPYWHPGILSPLIVDCLPFIGLACKGPLKAPIARPSDIRMWLPLIS